MFFVTKHLDICAAHQLDLPYDSPCARKHGHNYQCSITVMGEELNEYGMILDFAHIKRAVHNVLDHNDLNLVLPENVNPTAENICKWIAERIIQVMKEDETVPSDAVVWKVVVKETDGNEVVYKPLLAWGGEDVDPATDDLEGDVNASA